MPKHTRIVMTGNYIFSGINYFVIGYQYVIKFGVQNKYTGANFGDKLYLFLYVNGVFGGKKWVPG
jgi:hypothetical protein